MSTVLLVGDDPPRRVEVSYVRLTNRPAAGPKQALTLATVRC